jgi:hypothetical protein
MVDEEGQAAYHKACEERSKYEQSAHAWRLLAALGWALVLFCLLRINGVFGGSCSPAF